MRPPPSICSPQSRALSWASPELREHQGEVLRELSLEVETRVVDNDVAEFTTHSTQRSSVSLESNKPVVLSCDSAHELQFRQATDFLKARRRWILDNDYLWAFVTGLPYRLTCTRVFQCLVLLRSLPAARHHHARDRSRLGCYLLVQSSQYPPQSDPLEETPRTRRLLQAQRIPDRAGWIRIRRGYFGIRDPASAGITVRPFPSRSIRLDLARRHTALACAIDVYKT